MLRACPLDGSQEVYILCWARSLVRLAALTEFLADMLLQAEEAAQHAAAAEHHQCYLLVRRPGSRAAMEAFAQDSCPILALSAASSELAVVCVRILKLRE